METYVLISLVLVAVGIGSMAVFQIAVWVRRKDSSDGIIVATLAAFATLAVIAFTVDAFTTNFAFLAALFSTGAIVSAIFASSIGVAAEGGRSKGELLSGFVYYVLMIAWGAVMILG